MSLENKIEERLNQSLKNKEKNVFKKANRRKT